MKIETIEMFRVRGLYNYGYISPPVTEEDCLDKIVEFSSEKDIIIYEHKLKLVDENISEAEFYEPRECWWDIYSRKMGPKVPHCDKVYYLDIYYQ